MSTPTTPPRKKPPIRKSDVLKKFSQNRLAKLLGITHTAVQHWGEFIPERQATALRSIDPYWNRRKDFDMNLALRRYKA